MFKKSHQDFPLMAVLQADEVINAVTHGIGLVLSIVGAIILIARSYSQGDAYRTFGCTVFATTLVAVYATSTLSHAPLRPQLRIADLARRNQSYLPVAGDAARLEGLVGLTDGIADQAHDRHGIDCLLHNTNVA